MGCWNGTCMITNLPIFAGEEVYSIFIANKVYAHMSDDKPSYCYPNETFEPVGIWFQGEYNDYGALENCDALLDFNINMFKRYFMDYEGTDYDEAVTANELHSSNIFRLDHGGNIHLDIGTYRYMNMKHITVKKDVFERIMHYDPVDYDGESLQKRITNAIQQHKDDVDKWLEYDRELKLKPLYFPDTDYRLRDQHNLPCMSTMQCDAYLEENKEIVAIIDSHMLKQGVFNVFMMHGRRTYHPMSGAGSQDQETEVQRLVANMTIDAADKVDAYWDEAA